MKTIDLYLEVLRDVRYRVMANGDISLKDFAPDSKVCDLYVAFIEAANKLSALINIMEYEKTC